MIVLAGPVVEVDGTVADGTLVVDAAGQILLTNPAVEKLFGYGAGELIGSQVDNLVPMASRSPHAGQRATFVGEGRTRLMGNSPVVNGLRKDGTEFAITVSLSPLPARGMRGKCVSVSVRRVEN